MELLSEGGGYTERIKYGVASVTVAHGLYLIAVILILEGDQDKHEMYHLLGGGGGGGEAE